MSAAHRLQLVQLVAVADAGLVRVAWSAAWSNTARTWTRRFTWPRPGPSWSNTPTWS